MDTLKTCVDKKSNYMHKKLKIILDVISNIIGESFTCESYMIGEEKVK
jgi:hypothetical protein